MNTTDTCETELAALYASGLMPALPALTGSDKQIAWAEKIRAGKVVEVENVVVTEMQRVCAATRLLPHLAAVAAIDAEMAATLVDQTSLKAAERTIESYRTLLLAASASWWIDHRMHDIEMLAR